MQEFLGRLSPELGRSTSHKGAFVATGMIVGGWTYFILTGSISTIWPMFGIANQLLATVALAVGTTVLINAGRGRYLWVTLGPLCFVAITTLSAGFLSVRDSFWPMATGARPELRFQGYMNSSLTVIMMACVGIILIAAIRKWTWARSTITAP
jgi:carbon starvation protein